MTAASIKAVDIDRSAAVLWGRGVDPVFFGPDWELSDFHGSRKKAGQAPALAQLFRSDRQAEEPEVHMCVQKLVRSVAGPLISALSVTLSVTQWQEQSPLKAPEGDKDVTQEGEMWRPSYHEHSRRHLHLTRKILQTGPYGQFLELNRTRAPITKA